MRALLESYRFSGGVSRIAYVNILEVRLPGIDTGSIQYMRDIYIRCHRADDETTIEYYAFKTREEAETTPIVDTYIATGSGEGSGVTKSIIMTPVVDAVPQMAGLNLRVIDADNVVAFTDSVWCYSCAPDIEFAKDIAYILKLYTGPGLSLDAFSPGTGDEDLHITVGHPGVIHSYAFPHIAIVPLQPTVMESNVAPVFMRYSFPVSIQVAFDELKSKEDAWLECRKYAGAIHSILCDEKLELYGTQSAVDFNQITAPGGDPENQSSLFVSVLVVEHEINMFRDFRGVR